MGEGGARPAERSPAIMVGGLSAAATPKAGRMLFRPTAVRRRNRPNAAWPYNAARRMARFTATRASWTL